MQLPPTRSFDFSDTEAPAYHGGWHPIHHYQMSQNPPASNVPLGGGASRGRKMSLIQVRRMQEGATRQKLAPLIPQAPTRPRFDDCGITVRAPPPTPTQPPSRASVTALSLSGGGGGERRTVIGFVGGGVRGASRAHGGSWAHVALPTTHAQACGAVVAGSQALPQGDAEAAEQNDVDVAGRSTRVRRHGRRGGHRGQGDVQVSGSRLHAERAR